MEPLPSSPDISHTCQSSPALPMSQPWHIAVESGINTDPLTIFRFKVNYVLLDAGKHSSSAVRVNLIQSELISTLISDPIPINWIRS